MATAEALTETHRRGQLAVRNAAVTDVATVWRALDFESIDSITETWRTTEPALSALARAGRSASSALAADYFDEYRDASDVPGHAVPRIAPAAPADQVLTSLRVTGLYAARQGIARNIPHVADLTLVRASGAVGRLALDGGRSTLLRSVAGDGRAQGWSRVTDGKPCAFCAMVASRGPVYRSESNASFRSHDHCGCSVQPMYDPDQGWPGRAREFKTLWTESTKDLQRGEEPLQAFRRALQAR